jgi:hypothetical protein
MNKINIMKTLINTKDCSESCLFNFLFRLSFSVIGRISPVNMSALAVGTSLRITGSFRDNFRECDYKLFEKVSEMVFRIRKRYHRSKKKLNF